MIGYDIQGQQITKLDTFVVPKEGHMMWVEIHNQEELSSVYEQIEIHPLAKSSMQSFAVHLPKVDVYRHHAYIATYYLNKHFEHVKVNILVGKQYVITFAQEETELFTELREDMEDHPEHMSHPGHILHHVIEKISMFYLAMVDVIADHIQELEKMVFKTPFKNEVGHEVYNWKLRLHHIRKIVEAQETVIKTIGHSDFPYINEDAGFYFQDLQGQFSRVISAVDAFRENLTSIFDLQMSLKSDHMNVIMKTLTLVSVIFIPMTFIAGVYGMNFKHMPELEWDFGYPVIVICMLGIGLGILRYFKIKGWW